MQLQLKLLTTLAILVAQSAIAQDPDAALSKLPPDARDWVNRSCTRSLGPSLWSSCVVREASAASRGKPNLSSLNPEMRAWVIRSCSDSLGPSLTISCLTREKAALVDGLPNISSLTEEQKQWLFSSCSTSLGPSLFVACVQRESAALRGTQSAPQQPRAAASPAPRKLYSTPSRSSGHESYKIEVAHNDELFIINGEKFESQTYCLGWEEGDEVLFLEGSPVGACTSAELLNLRTREKCDVWCE
ncbi:hypothetical protein PS854_04438 [Pseudomonas fluorescens]|uniref:Uncharacterized protein n=1 Tax=Pseudomonas fluorescens TaxID=294 RepID=A0A5E7N8M6_PSEFL|nr:hypothetical protein PS854_04438 [Pseudomonas fluorescens]